MLEEGHEKDENNFKFFNFYEGYSKLFKVPSKRSIFSPILFLSVVSLAVST